MDHSLCLPDHEKTCFACCPPIRPAGYEHIQYSNIIKRILRENSKGFDKRKNKIIPITGFSCWALGYIDENHKLAGCLLHPDQNKGVDLRYRVDYGEKCRREFCHEARVFSELGINERIFWLHLADGLDSFSYSSRKLNPLPNMIGWGGYLLRLIASTENNRILTRGSFFKSYPFFSTSILPRANAYLINWLIKKKGTNLLKRKRFGKEFERFTRRLSHEIVDECSFRSEDPYIHRLDLDGDFKDFLRLSTPMHKLNKEKALLLKEKVDSELEKFRMNLH